MELKIGDIIQYTFPEPLNGIQKNIVGEITFMGESFVKIRFDSGIQMQIRYKNFNRIEKLKIVHKVS